jgi:hypothetical protein
MDIDTICKMTTRPQTLNALHACRDGHPLGKNNNWKWRNAAAMVFLNPDISMSARDWVEKQASAEREAHPL